MAKKETTTKIKLSDSDKQELRKLMEDKLKNCAGCISCDDFDDILWNIQYFIEELEVEA